MRLFAGIPLDAAARAFVAEAADALKRDGVRARWTPAENWHVTLAFLGDVDDAAVPSITSAFNSVVGPAADSVLGRAADSVLGRATLAHSRAPFSLRLSTIGAFPTSRRPRVLWVGGQEQDQQFSVTSLALRSVFEPLGFHFEAGPLAHVTIGRTTGSGPLHPPRLAAVHAMPVTRLALFESIRVSAGVRYEEREVMFL